ncbi:MAG: hypothetical protein Q9M16_03710 [Mariprofundus sp.]|nr:hypothetical protein [Mariprofundus sp.]
MKIEAFKEIEYKTSIDTFVVMFNPANYNQKYEVEYEEAQGQGTTGSTQKFKAIKPQEYSFDFVFDGTGVSGEKKEVADDVERFMQVTGKINSDIHRPLFLKISWGALLTHCVLKSADISYDLFKPDGSPLRAKIKATFAVNIDDTLRAAEDGLNSPDLTHYRMVKAGDTLPLMTYRIYGDSSYYLDVAAANALTDFRNLTVGSSIFFPPLKQST